MKTVAIAGTFDTKGREFAYVKRLVSELGLKPFIEKRRKTPSFSYVDISREGLGHRPVQETS